MTKRNVPVVHLPFYNYTISPEIIFRNKNQTEKRTTYPTVNFTEEDYEGGAIEKVYKIKVKFLLNFLFLNLKN